ncbi:MAG: DsbA family protein [Alphaproteobacteria bacterium]|nr:DsbA family protein [Alphaproteobacteria bacterium]
MKTFPVVALGAVAGAAIAITVVFGAAAIGLFPQDDRHFRNFLMAHPEVLADASARFQEQQDDEDDRLRQQAIDRIGQKPFFDPHLAFVTGPANARTTFVEFFDYNCPHCRKSVTAVQHFYNAHRNTARFAFFEFPIQGPPSVVAARAALAARKQPDKYMAYHFAMMNEDGPVDEDAIFEDARRVGLDVNKLKTDMNDPAVAATISQTIALAHRAHVNGTPEFIVDGSSREGEVDDATLGEMTKMRVSHS